MLSSAVLNDEIMNNNKMTKTTTKHQHLTVRKSKYISQQCTQTHVLSSSEESVKTENKHIHTREKKIARESANPAHSTRFTSIENA